MKSALLIVPFVSALASAKVVWDGRFANYTLVQASLSIRPISEA